MTERTQPLYKFGDTLVYSNRMFTVTHIEYRDSLTTRPDGYYYADSHGVMHHEVAVKIFDKVIDVLPITRQEFHNKWQELYGCTWNSPASGNTYEGLIMFLTERGLMK